MGKRIGGTLEKWYLDCNSVKGYIYGDDNWNDGEHIRTSYIVKFYREKGIVETHNTIYKLGEEN